MSHTQFFGLWDLNVLIQEPTSQNSGRTRDEMLLAKTYQK